VVIDYPRKLIGIQFTHFFKLFFYTVIRFFFFFFDMSTQEGGGRIRTSDHHFIKRGPSQLNYLLGTDKVIIMKNCS
jgi:hypothetical protein